jgi:hypothetical protein
MARKAPKRPALNIEADLTEGYKALGFVQGLSTTVSTNRFISSVIELAHDRMAQDFDREIDQVALSNQNAFAHVYEWRMTGIPQGRLWHHTLTGRGVNRQASWQWEPSKAPILTPEERKARNNPNDPINNVSDEDIARLSSRDYFFTWKAPVMEYGLRVNITAKYAKALFIPSFSAEKGYYFSKSSFNQMPNNNAGRFTGFWTAWWTGGGAASTWDSHIRTVIEKDIGRAEKELGKAKKRRKTFSISTVGSNDAAFEAGRNYAEAYILGRAKNYKQAARYIDKNGRFGGDVNYPS